MIFGKWVSQALSVVARFRVADHLAGGPKTAAELARLTDTKPGPLYRVLRALGGVGVLAEDADGRFALTPVGEYLRSDVPGSLRPIAIYCCDPWSWQAWGGLAESVRTGETAFNRVLGCGPWEYLKDHPDEAATFNEGMIGFSQQMAGPVTKAYDFSQFHTVVDVGGGHGALLTAILKANPNVRGVVYDLPQVVEGAGPALRAAGLADRCRAMGGDFFQEVPSGGDAYLMKHIIHDWNDAKATEILRNCRKAMKSTAKLLLAEIVIPPAGVPSPGKLLDLEMLVICDGKERTEAEYRALLAGAGFRLTRVIPTEAPVSIIEGEPV
jgi:hypothetical protein